MIARVGAAAVLLAALATACRSAPPPLPEVLVVADTDVPIALASSRLRVDLFAEDGTWFESSSFSRPDPRDWPVSFGVYGDDDGKKRRVWVRLRAYPDGRERDYRGENPHSWGGPLDLGAAKANAPRLLKGGQDVTPPSEPDPLVTVDRLGLVELSPGQVTQVRFVLHGACVGTTALFGDDPAKLVLGQAQTCVDTERARVVVAPAAPEPAETPIGASRAGSWLAGDACPKPDDASERVCVPGGATLLGASDPANGAVLPGTPARLFGARRFFLDRYEVTVGKLRDAFARGLKVPRTPNDSDPHVNDGALDATLAGHCTYSSKPIGREDYPVNCISWFAARAYCQLNGGDLPTELQWEHAASVAGRSAKTLFPWGNEPPTCDRAVYGGMASGTGLPECTSAGDTVKPLAASARDLTPLGIHQLGGSLGEYALDDGRAYADACWGDAPIVDARCGDPDKSAPLRAIRGSNFEEPMLFSTTRFAQDPIRQSILVGFRCAYAEAGN